MSFTVSIPGLVVKSEANLRGGWWSRASRSKKQKAVTLLALGAHGDHEAREHRGELVVTLTRIAPRQLDDDNLAGGFKAIRDAVALWLHRDDGSKGGVRWLYEQRRGKGYGVQVEVGW